MINRVGKYPYISDEARMNIHQASHLVSICLILLFILTSSISCAEVILQNTTSM